MTKKLQPFGKIVLHKVDEVCTKQVFLRSKIVNGGYSAEWSWDGNLWTSLDKPSSNPEKAMLLARQGAFLSHIQKKQMSLRGKDVS